MTGLIIDSTQNRRPSGKSSCPLSAGPVSRLTGREGGDQERREGTWESQGVTNTQGEGNRKAGEMEFDVREDCCYHGRCSRQRIVQMGNPFLRVCPLPAPTLQKWFPQAKPFCRLLITYIWEQCRCRSGSHC